MTNEEFQELRKTFPWTYKTFKAKVGLTITVYDKDGKIIDAKTLVDFLVMITERLKK